MGETVSVKELLNIVKNIALYSILGRKFLKTIAVIAAVSTIISTYFLVEVSKCASILVREFKQVKFEESVKRMLLMSGISLFFRYIPSFIYTYVMQLIMRREFVSLSYKYLKLSYVRFHSKTPGKMRYLIFLRAYAIPMVTQVLVFELSRLIGMTFFICVNAAKNTNLFSAAIFILIPLIYVCSTVFYVKKRLGKQKRYLEEQEITSSVLYDKLINYEIIKTYNLEMNTCNDFYMRMGELEKTYASLGIFDGHGTLLISFVMLVPFVTLMFFSNEGKTVLTLILLHTYLSAQLKMMVDQFIKLMDFAYQIKFTEIRDDEPVRHIEMPPFNRTIEIKNVTAFYNNDIVFKDVNAMIFKGERIAIVGPNGTGKSTFIKLLMGFTKYTGDILFDGRSTKEFSRESILKNISYIPQKDYVSDDTIMNNLRVGNYNATENFIKYQARIYGVHDEFEAFPDGYQTLTGPRGNKLSGGQLQKLAILRAAIKDAPIFILDEATSAIDKHSETFMIESLWNNLNGKTLLMIIHGRKHLEKFDRVFFFNNFTLEAIGSYKDLLASSENFKKFIS